MSSLRQWMTVSVVIAFFAGIAALVWWAPWAGSTTAGDEEGVGIDTEALVGTWRLDSVAVDGEFLALPDATTRTDPTAPLWVSFDGAALTGEGPCNAFGGPYVVEGAEVVPGEVSATLVACADDAANEFERLALDAIATGPARVHFTGRGAMEWASGATVLYLRKA